LFEFFGEDGKFESSIILVSDGKNGGQVNTKITFTTIILQFYIGLFLHEFSLVA